MLKTWISKERLLSNSTPSSDDEELTKNSHQVLDSVLGYYLRSYVFQVLGPIVNTCFFQNLAVRNNLSSCLLYRPCILLVFQIGMCHQAAKKYRTEHHQHNNKC